MAQPFVGEIRMFAGNFAPAGLDVLRGAAAADLRERDALRLIGTTYGGDGESTFALPDLRGRIPIHQGNGFILAETGGAEEITLTVNQIAAHTPPAAGADDTAQPGQPRRSGASALLAVDTSYPYIEDTANGDWRRRAITPGRRQPAAHELPAVPLHQLHHLAVRHLPPTHLRTSHG